MNRSERIPTIEEFGQQLLETGDLDPLYIALHGANLEKNHLRRWLFAYWCCYHAGAASCLSEREGRDYWQSLEIMALNETQTPLGTRWPRGHERRHFRGTKAIEAVQYYAKTFPDPEIISLEFERPLGNEPLRYSTLRERVMKLPQFGPWIAFKVADMLERIMGIPISFKDADVLMFDQPYKSALNVWQKTPGSEIAKDLVSNDHAVHLVAAKLTRHFSHQFSAPPKKDRPVNIQEVETILCKWKSHNTGSYPMGIDTFELRHGLGEWAMVSPTAQRLLEAAPSV